MIPRKPHLGKRKPPSIIESGYIRTALKPQASAKDEISFSPRGYFDENTNVRHIDQYVREHFDQQKENIPQLDQEIHDLQTKLNTQVLRVIEQRKLKQEIEKLESEKKKRLSNDPYQEYRDRIGPFLDEWDQIQMEQGSYVRFGEERKFCPEKLVCIQNVVRIASDYVPLNLILKPSNKSGHCPHCRNPYINDDDGKIICEDCGIYQDSLANDVDFSDLDRINGSGNDYVNQETFEKAVMNYQGKQQVEFPDSLGPDFDKYCVENRVCKKNLTQETTRPIFKALGYNDFYDDINLFLFLHLGKPLHDISEYEYILLQDYILFYQKYNECKGDDRDSALGAQYVLYILMQRRGISCDKRDLRLADTPNIRKENDNIARRVFKHLNWTFKDTI